MPDLLIDRRRLRYAVDGPEARPPLLFLNSLGTTLEMWDPQVARLDGEFRVLRLDARGHGGSARSAGGYGVGDLADDARALLDHLRVDRAHVCGLSLGGLTAQALALAAPERVASLTLANTAAHIPSAELWNARIETVRAQGLSAIADAVLARWFAEDFADRDPAATARLRAMLLSIDAGGYADACAAVRDADHRADLGRIAAPALVIAGELDTATPPAMSDALADGLPHGRRLEIPGVGHLSNVEEPEAFTAALAAFLAPLVDAPRHRRKTLMSSANDTPCIICVAITGSLPQKSDNPAVPISIAEQIESTHEAFEAGAALVHAHVREEDGTPTSDPERFARLMEGIRTHCPGMIVQLSTGGRSGAGRTRGGMLSLRPDMASLSVGSNNFPTRVYENPPDLVDWLAEEMRRYGVKPEIEAFDLSHIHQAAAMAADGRIEGPLHVQFVMGVQNAMPLDRPSFGFFIETLRRLAPDATWCGAGIGRGQAIVNDWSIALGGHTRTGLEDNVRLDRETLAPSNAALVRRAVEICARHGRPVADWRAARGILGLAQTA